MPGMAKSNSWGQRLVDKPLGFDTLQGCTNVGCRRFHLGYSGSEDGAAGTEYLDRTVRPLVEVAGQ